MQIDERLVQWTPIAPDGDPQRKKSAIDERLVKWTPIRAPDALDNPNPTDGMSTFDKLAAGAGKAVADLGRGAGQWLGFVDRKDIEASRRLDRSLMDTTAGKVGNFAGNAAAFAPTALIPGANTVTGAAAIGAIGGALQPSVSTGDTLSNIALGGAGGAVGQAAGNWIGAKLSTTLAQKEADAARQKSLNALRDAALQRGREAGYVLPPSQVSPSFLSNRLESLGGKAAIKQEATIRNQDVTNTLARKALGLPEDQPISLGSLETIRSNAGGAYKNVAALSDTAAADLEALKQARNDAQGWFKAYNRSASPDDLAKARAARELSDKLEESLRQAAAGAGREDLIPSLSKARKDIAKSYTVERALNSATGDVSAPVLGRLYEKGGSKYLSDGLDTIGAFNAAFPNFTGAGWKSPAPGVSKVEAMMSALLGAGGAAATGSPLGLLAAAAPLASHPARAWALSMQGAPSYSVGAMPQVGGLLSPVARRGALPLTGGVFGALEWEQ